MPPTGSDLSEGVELADIPQGETLRGQAQGEAVLLVRSSGGEEVFTIGSTCTHHGGPVAEGLAVGDTVLGGVNLRN